MYLLVGSTAIKHQRGHSGLIPPREPGDRDYFVHTAYEHPGQWPKGYDTFSHPDLDEYIYCTSPSANEFRVATLDELYTLKVSHGYWELKNGSWNKHIFDMRWLKARGARLDQSFHDLLYGVWVKVHGPKKTNLSMEKGEFFKDAVVRVYDHDSLHNSVAYGDTAMYERILKDGSTVDVDSGKMWGLSHEDLVKLFREEVYATALERIVIPKDYRCSPGAAYRWALRRTITSLTKGKSAQFILENFEEFAIPDDYVSRHLANKSRLVRL